MGRSCGHRGSRRFPLQSVLALAGNKVLADETVSPAGKPSDQLTPTGWHKFSKQVAGCIGCGKRLLPLFNRAGPAQRSAWPAAGRSKHVT